jgi:hypothetical protein
VFNSAETFRNLSVVGKKIKGALPVAGIPVSVSPTPKSREWWTDALRYFALSGSSVPFTFVCLERHVSAEYH